MNDHHLAEKDVEDVFEKVHLCNKDKNLFGRNPLLNLIATTFCLPAKLVKNNKRTTYSKYNYCDRSFVHYLLF